MNVLIARIQLEALVTEREAMVAANQHQRELGRGITYTDASFKHIADEMRVIASSLQVASRHLTDRIQE